jgi:DNA repair protein RadC
MKENNSHDGHRKRLKERFIREGLKNFEPHQVLELILFFTIPRRDTNEIAHNLIKKFGSVADVFEADVKDLITVDGIAENSAVFLSLISAVSGYYLKSKHGEKTVIDSSSKAGDYVLSLFVGKKYEVFYLICLDSQNRVTWADILSEGTLNETSIYPRNLVEIALRHNANSIIIAHNHPGGSLKPSSSDINATKNIKNALDTINIKLIDHIIVGDHKYMSFAESGLI